MPGSLRPTGDNTVCDIRPEPVRASTRVVWRRTIEWKTSMGSVSCARMKFSGDSNHSRCQYSRCSNNSSSARRGARSTQIIPVNYSLLLVNVFVTSTGGYQLYRRYGAYKSGAVKNFW